MTGTDDPVAARRLRAAGEAARILKPFGGEGARRAHELHEALRTGGHASPEGIQVIESALLDALMDTRVKSKASPRKTSFLHVLVPEKPLRPDIRAVYKEFEAAFARRGGGSP